MPIPANIDFDKLVSYVLEDLFASYDGWINGQPRDETALLNRITEKLSRRRRGGCDVGIKYPSIVVSSLHFLHRKGNNQTDKYGCDLAVTLNINNGSWKKTALFQFKKGNDLAVELEARQLDDALRIPQTKKRCYVIAVDDGRYTYRIRDMEILRSEIKEDNKTKKFGCEGWIGISEWLYGWLSCDIGPFSDEKYDESVENILDKYIIYKGSMYRNDNINPNDDSPIPARVWLKYIIEKHEI